MEFLAQVERSGLATWARESPSIWAYPTILTLHTLGLAIVVGASAVIDLRLLGVSPRIPIAAIRPLFSMIRWAFVLNFTTGVVLFMTDATHKSVQVVFYVKLAFITLALLNLAAISRRLDDPQARTGFLAFASLCLWTSAIVAGRLMAYL